MSETQAAPAPEKKKANWKLRIFLFFGLVAAAIFLPTTIVLAVGMLPTLVALITDRSPTRSATITTGSMNFAGVVPQLFVLWQGNHTPEGALRLLLDYSNLVIMYSAALIGIIIYNNVTPLVSLIVYRKAQLRLKDIEKRLKNLKEIWGEDVATALR